MKQCHILAYDVREEKRLRKVHSYLKKRGLPLQKSVFLLHCTASELADTLQGLRERVSLREDDVRLYPVHAPQSIWVGGQQSRAVQDLYMGNPVKEANESWLQQISKALFG